MLTLWGKRAGRNCEGATRRDFLKVGALGTAALSLPALLRSRAEAASQGSKTVNDTSVVWLWLGGGPTHIETFDPKMSAPSEFRSTVGAIETSVPGIQIGSVLPHMAQVAQHMAFVRSFAHSNSGHGGGTHYVMTGYDNKGADNGAPSTKPSLGSITSRYRGASNSASGIPSYVRMSNVSFDGPAWLGATYAPFDVGGQARRNMDMNVQLDRLSDRRGLLKDLDRISRDVDRSGMMQGLDEFEGQAFNLIMGSAKAAFDVSKEDPKLRSRYGSQLGEQLLTARRLCEAGCGFVSLQYGGWDMHGKIVSSLNQKCPDLDRAVAAFVQDVADRGLQEKILLVITGEFGRTPRVNNNAGRDHWAPLSTLALSGGGLKTGLVVGESSAKAEVPQTRPIGPQDLMATVFHVLGMPAELSYKDRAGRPVPMVNSGQAIPELV
jgi:hypothetical protein